ncbi:MAG: 23S rRNA pseudouridine(955/2504/2580) synthase RluC [Gammaproteobacteria bacterium]
MDNNEDAVKLKSQIVEIMEENDGQRLDNYLLFKLKGVPKSRIYRMVRKGEVRINKKRCEAKSRLAAGDRVRIPPVRMSEKSETVYVPAPLRNSLENDILFEDDTMLILNKPSGFAVHGGSGLNSGIIESLRVLRPEQRFLELVHRLDRDTSGCLLIAKKSGVLKKLHELFRGSGIDKTYLALLAGKWERKKMRVEAPLQKNVSKGGERLVVVSKAGKAAETLFRRVRLFRNATLVEAMPKTGRTHQIRVHAAWLGHPIIGDSRYGHDEINLDFKRLGMNRLFLHAYRLSFIHPETNYKISVQAPLPDDLEAFLKAI